MDKALVAYFSATGTTERIAGDLAAAIGADLFRIEPETPYEGADLDWRDATSRATIEMNDDACRPPIKAAVGHMGDYDTIFLGFPIWWYVEPRVIDTFLEAHDLAGKTIVPFATSGSSAITRASERISTLVPKATVLGGSVLGGSPSQEQLAGWAIRILGA
ncbi:MAG: flavodoxin [Olsenella sp.]|nr:flavodoxin [Olsenella sp.]